MSRIEELRQRVYAGKYGDVLRARDQMEELRKEATEIQKWFVDFWGNWLIVEPSDEEMQRLRANSNRHNLTG